MPNLVGEVTAENTPQVFYLGVLSVEEAAGGEVVGIATYHELLVGGEGIVRILLKVAKPAENILVCGTSQNQGIQSSSFYASLLYEG